MNARMKSVLIIVGTLVVGMVLGALGAGAVFNSRLDELEALRMPGGVHRLLERGIEPVDEAQREQIRNAIGAVEARQMELRRYVAQQHRLLFDSLRTELAEILTDEQQAALRERIQRERESVRFRRSGPPNDDGDRRRRSDRRRRDHDTTSAAPDASR